jgi:hypothetical protein
MNLNIIQFILLLNIFNKNQGEYSVTNKGIVAKIYHQNNEVILAACDEELLGKNFEDGDLQLQVHSSFYDGFQVDETKLVQYLQNSTIANLVGETVIQCALRAGLVSDDCIIRIKGIPHAQICRLV